MENQGEAIPEEEQRRLFEKFYHDSNPEEGHYGWAWLLHSQLLQNIIQR